MKTEFDIKMTTASMYRFLMYHAYHSFSGIFSIVAGAALIFYYIWSLGKGGANTWIYLLFGTLFLVYQPWTLYTGAVKQAKLNPVFKNPLHYTLSEEGILARQVEAESNVAWTAVRKVRETSDSILIYTGPKNACILIKKQMGSQTENVREILKKNVSPALVKLKR